MTLKTPQKQSSASSADKKITITGCLAAAPAGSAASTATGTTGTTGTAGTAATAGTAGTAPAFQLTNATAAAADSPESAAGPTPTDPAKTAEGQTYRLIANPTALSPHVGKKLALTGTLEPPDPTAAAAAGSEAKGSTLRVETGKVIAESCTQQ